jgi:undecaprenyl-diphosphatase
MGVQVMSKVINYLKNKDIDLLFFFNQRIQKDILDTFMKLVTQLGSIGFAMGFPIALMLTPNSQTRMLGFHLALGLIISSILVFSIKLSIRRARPFESFEDIKTLFIPKDKNSFPSGHTCAAMTMGMIISQSISSIASTFVIGLSILVGISRMYLGVHYPSDVIFGGTIALVTVSFIVPMFI